MSAFLNGLKVAQKLSSPNPLLLRQVARNLAGWNKDFLPDNYPKTQKQHEESAKKYGMLPAEYRPYADDGLGYGDYPKLTAGLGIEAKDSYYPYDFPEHKRNLHEPLHADIDLYGEDRYSQPDHPRYTNRQYWGSFLGVMTAMFVLYYWLEDKKMYRPAAAKQYPYKGQVHYTFD